MKEENNFKKHFLIFLAVLIGFNTAVYFYKKSKRDQDPSPPRSEKKEADFSQGEKTHEEKPSQDLRPDPSKPQKKSEVNDQGNPMSNDPKSHKRVKKVKYTPMELEEFTKLSPKIIQINERFTISGLDLVKVNQDKNFEAIIRMKSNNRPYFLNAIVDKNTGKFLKTWGYMIHENRNDVIITAPEQN